MTKGKLRKLLTKPKFRAWLEAKKPRAIIGLALVSDRCPIANYLTSETGDHIHAYPSGIYAGEHHGIIGIVPRWGRRFMGMADFRSDRNITASRALKILDGIK